MTHNDLTNFDYWDTLYNDEYLEYKENHILGEEWYEPQCDAILEHLLNLFSEKNISILDVGCGNGLFLKRLAGILSCCYMKKKLLLDCRIRFL
jgi:EEF1A lysine methyltransferase 2